MHLLEMLLLENQYRNKTVIQKLEEAERWEKIEKTKARNRQSKLNGKTVLCENFHKAKRGRANDVIAARVGLGSGRTYETGKKVKGMIEYYQKQGQEKSMNLLTAALNRR